MYLRTILFLCSVFLTCANSHAVAQARPEYNIELQVDLEKGELQGRATIAFPESAITDGTVLLDTGFPKGGRMDVRRIASPSMPLEYYTLDDGEALVIDLDGLTSVIEVEYVLALDSRQLDPFGYFVFAEFGSSRWPYPEILQASKVPFPFSDFA